MKKYILTIDQGTTSTRSILFDKNANMVTMSQLEIGLTCPASGWVEQDALEIWVKTYETIANVLKQANATASEIAGIAITNQRETTVLWDKNTGVPIYNAVVWQSRQSQDICDELINQGYKEFIQSKTGLIINSYFSGSKIAWILKNVENAIDLVNQGKINFGTIDSYVLWQLTGHNVHATDYTNASRTLLFNIYDLKWDNELLKLFNIPSTLNLPKVEDCNALFGYATGLIDIDPDFKDVPITSIIGDQQASLFGQCCYEKGSAKNTYGTGCFMLMNTVQPVKNPGSGLLSTIAWSIDGKMNYALEGSVFIGGAGIQWLRDKMQFFESAKDAEKFIHLPNPSNGVYMVPAFVGLGTPYWDSDARGAIFGLTRDSSKDNIIAATMESIAYQSKEVFDAMVETSGVDIIEMGVDGGACVNSYLMQFQSDISNVNIIRPTCKETTALGATYIAGLKVGFFESIEQIKSLRTVECVFTPNMSSEERNNKIKGWKKAVQATLMYK